MTNPWETGEKFCGIRSAWCDSQSRIDAAKTMPVERLQKCLAYPDTQKSVRRFIERRLRAHARARGGQLPWELAPSPALRARARAHDDTTQMCSPRRPWRASVPRAASGSVRHATRDTRHLKPDLRHPTP